MAAVCLPNRYQLSLWLAALMLAHAAASGAQAPSLPEASVAPAYVTRGKQTEARQREFTERRDRFHHNLSEALRDRAPDLLLKLEPPPSEEFGYQHLPRLIADAPPPQPARPQVVSFSWGWSDTLIAREVSALEGLEADLSRLPGPLPAASRVACEALVAGYTALVDRFRPIDADVDYNWLWQARIARDRPTFDRLTARLEAARARQAEEETRLRLAATSTAPVPAASPTLLPTTAATPVVPEFDLPGFVGIEQPARGQWLFTVPLYTDITDAGFVEAFRSALETYWHVRTPDAEFRLTVRLEVVPPQRLYCSRPDETRPIGAACAPPAVGEHIDLAAHVAHFPNDVAVLTTGAASLQLTTARALVLGPHDLQPRVIAHEFGHLLGLPDAYLRGYRDLGADGFQVMELVPDMADIMASPGAGTVQARHFEEMLMAREIGSHMVAGLDALYQRNDPVEAVKRFRAVLARNPTHYGATLQLAKALDSAGRPQEALETWRKILAMAQSLNDAETIATATTRLAPR